MIIAALQKRKKMKREEIIKYLDQLENMLVRIEKEKDTDWKDVLYLTRALHYLFKEVVKNERFL